ncbi:hypothetical protein CR201_G0056474, partial [Pongo abelii]
VVRNPIIERQSKDGNQLLNIKRRSCWTRFIVRCAAVLQHVQGRCVQEEMNNTRNQKMKALEDIESVRTAKYC